MKTRIDIILVSDAKNKHLHAITLAAIASLGKSASVFVVESNKEVEYDNATTIHPSSPFNYNSYLNIGASYGSSEYIFFGNNDLLFGCNWDDIIIKAMEKHEVVSASPYSPHGNSDLLLHLNSEVIHGYEIIRQFCGWAFVWKRSFFELKGGLDEEFEFWCADNIAVEQLKRSGHQHVLVPRSIVQHLGRSTMGYLDRKTRAKYTVNCVEKFNKKFNTNLWEASYIKNSRKMDFRFSLQRVFSKVFG